MGSIHSQVEAVIVSRGLSSAFRRVEPAFAEALEEELALDTVRGADHQVRSETGISQLPNTVQRVLLRQTSIVLSLSKDSKNSSPVSTSAIR